MRGQTQRRHLRASMTLLATLAIACPAFAQSVDEARLELFVKLVCEAGGTMNEAVAEQVFPPNGFDRSEVFEIVYALEDRGQGVRDGAAGTFTLSDEVCAD